MSEGYNMKLSQPLNNFPDLRRDMEPQVRAPRPGGVRLAADHGLQARRASERGRLLQL